MALHLEEIGPTVAPGAHAILVLDQAGWHVSKALPAPPNITLVPLPAKSRELNPAENIWQYMRDNSRGCHLANFCLTVELARASDNLHSILSRPRTRRLIG
jgi:transposase